MLSDAQNQTKDRLKVACHEFECALNEKLRDADIQLGEIRPNSGIWQIMAVRRGHLTQEQEEWLNHEVKVWEGIKESQLGVEAIMVIGLTDQTPSQ